MEPIPPPGPPTTFNPPKKKASGCVGCLVGCLVAAVVVLLLLGGAGYYAYNKYAKKMDPKEFVSKGFKEEKNSEQIIKRGTDVITGKTVLSAPSVEMGGKADSDLAIVGIVAKVDGIVNGNLYFRGMALEIGPRAVILGDVDVDCMAAVVEGYVKGEIKGNYLAVDQERRAKLPPEDLELPAEPQSEKAPEVPESPPPPVAPPPQTVPAPEAPAQPAPTETSPAPEPPANEPVPEPPPAEEPPPPAAPSEPPPAPGAPTPPSPDPVEPAPAPTPAPPSE